ncbi:unnamed protein product, partial [Rotaria magnacalcarata]
MQLPIPTPQYHWMKPSINNTLNTSTIGKTGSQLSNINTSLNIGTKTRPKYTPITISIPKYGELNPRRSR